MSELFDFYNLFTRKNKKTIVIFKGNFTETILHDLAKALKGRLSAVEEKKISRRIFAIFIELAQNIYHYSADKISIDDSLIGDGIIHIFEKDDCYVIQSGNAIYSKEYDTISKKIDLVNKKDVSELKQMKKDILKQERVREGAGFGLIEVAIQSGSDILCEAQDINDELCFLKLEVKICKEI